MPQVDLYYSQTLLGHFTIIVYDKVDLIAYRIHLVDRSAESAHGGKLAWAKHKIAQVTGFATSEVLSDFKSSPNEFTQRINYSAENRSRIKQWTISVPHMDKMLKWIHQRVQNQNQGHYGNYGYVIYSSGVENCGSFAIECLQQAGISITLPYLKSWLQLPSVIKNDI
ncbi:hypothetical protein [Microbulbifer sp. ANSA005]|uniref:hypothetical protein n=1 Tax=Microbulbifer sp. ANSA005 TaxID=3243362 RepID=UPI0040414217